MNPVFYHPDLASGNTLLSVEECWHASKVLRLKRGDPVVLVDGKGCMAEAIIAEISSKSCLLSNMQIRSQIARESLEVHIAMAPTKQIERFEFFLEKATEIGISRITPLICANSERRQLRLDRLQKLLVSAMKQSQKAFLPILDEPVSFNSFVEVDYSGLRAIAHCMDGEKQQLLNLVKDAPAVQVLIGPEGDFNSAEVQLAIEAGFIPVSLGTSRLRTETAGIVALLTVQLSNQQAG